MKLLRNLPGFFLMLAVIALAFWLTGAWKLASEISFSNYLYGGAILTVIIIIALNAQNLKNFLSSADMNRLRWITVGVLTFHTIFLIFATMNSDSKPLVACSLAVGVLSALYLIFLMNMIDQPIGKAVIFVLFMLLVSTFIIQFAVIYLRHGVNCNGAPIKDLSIAIYFSAVTWTTLGYGDCSPTNETQFWATSEALLGYLFMGLLTAIILKMLSKKDE